MKLLHFALVAIFISVMIFSYVGSASGQTDKTLWYRYTVLWQENGTSGGTYFHVFIHEVNDGTSGSVRSEPVSGNPLPWSKTLTLNLGDNYTEYCSMSTAIRQYLQHLNINPIEIRFSQITLVSHDGTQTSLQTDFYLLGSSNDSATMEKIGFEITGPQNTRNSKQLFDCNITSPDIQEQLQLFKEQTEWKSINTSTGSFTEPTQSANNFDIPYRTINGTGVLQTHDYTFVANTYSKTNGIFEIKIPRNFPYYNGKDGPSENEKYIILENGANLTPSQYDKTVSDCFFTYSIPFYMNSTITVESTDTSYLMSPIYGDKIPDYCMSKIMIPEFPFVQIILIMSIMSTIVFYRVIFRK